MGQRVCRLSASEERRVEKKFREVLEKIRERTGGGGRSKGSELSEVRLQMREAEGEPGEDDGRGAGIAKDEFRLVFKGVPALVRPSRTMILRYFNAFDEDQDGLVRLDEFKKGIAICCHGSLEDKIDFMFKLQDVDGDGEITKPEYTKVATSAMKSFHKKMRDELQSRSVEWQAFEVGAKEGIRKGVEKFFAAADIDGDGAVDRDEFTQHMRENREAQKILDHLGLSFSGIIKSEMKKARQAEKQWQRAMERIKRQLHPEMEPSRKHNCVVL